MKQKKHSLFVIFLHTATQLNGMTSPKSTRAPPLIEMKTTSLSFSVKSSQPQHTHLGIKTSSSVGSSFPTTKKHHKLLLQRRRKPRRTQKSATKNSAVPPRNGAFSGGEGLGDPKTRPSLSRVKLKVPLLLLKVFHFPHRKATKGAIYH